MGVRRRNSFSYKFIGNIYAGGRIFAHKSILISRNLNMSILLRIQESKENTFVD